MIVHPDYLTVNFYTDYAGFMPVWSKYFSTSLGNLVSAGRTAFYQARYDGSAGAILLAEPIEVTKDGRNFVTLTLPGEALGAISFEVFRTMARELDKQGLDYRVTRWDVSFDGLPITPQAVYDRLCSDKVRTLAKRSSISWYAAPYQVNDIGGIGTTGVSIGSRSSGRMLRVYDLHGYNRVELQARAERSDLIFRHMAYGDNWPKIAVMHLNDYIAFPGWAEWELAFSEPRANCKLTQVREVSAHRLEKWLYKQVSVGLSVLQDLQPGAVFPLLSAGRKKKSRKKYDLLFDDTATEDVLLPEIGNGWYQELGLN